MNQRDDDAELEAEIARQERICEMEALKLTGLYTQREMRQFRNMLAREMPRP